MINNPKISVITVSYNAVKTIEQTICSVINQTYDNIEYIIIDGGSADGTVDIIKKYKDKIAYWVSQADHGIYDAMNKGIARASGDFIYFLGADDSLTSKAVIGEVCTYLAQNEKVDILSGRIWLVDERYNIQKVLENKVSSEEWLENGYMIPHQGMFARRQVLYKYPFSLQFRIAADYEFFLRTIFDEKIVFHYVDTIVAYYSLSGISAMEDEARVREHVCVMKKFFSLEMAERYGAQYTRKKDVLLRKAKEICKRILVNLKLMRYVNLRRGWEIHSCDNDFCRWCKRLKS